MPEPLEDLSRDPLLERLAKDLRHPVARNLGVDRALATLRTERRRRRALQLAVAAALVLAGAGVLQSLRGTRPVRFVVQA